MLAEVLVEVKAKQIEETFTYHIPDSLLDEVVVGKRVLVPFGPRKVEGFVLSIVQKEVDFPLKDVEEVIDEEAILNKELLDLGKYISQITFSSLISSYQVMLPKALKARHGKKVAIKEVSYISLIDATYHPRTPKQKELLDLLQGGPVLKKELENYSSSLKTLLEKGILEETKKEVYRRTAICEVEKERPTLTSEQEEVIERVEKKKSTFSPFLLHGVTGSGKTEVYMRLIEGVLKDKKEAIVLVPEISLTPQLVETFESRFGDNIAILHSGLSEGEKYDEWRKIVRGEVSIVIGARSAIFAPFTHLGIIIVDEEHTATYKQENNPKYHAITIALKRAKYHSCPLLLGSASPSLESYTRAKLGIYELLTMKKRIYSSLPRVDLIDMKENLKRGYPIFSKELVDALTTCFENQEQAILLLNRRGYSTVVTCHECGYKVTCPNCEIPLTYHKRENAMKCHYCDYTTSKPKKCPECGSMKMDEFGLGTEKLEEEFHRLFPQQKSIRMDVDTTSRKGSHDAIIKKFRSKEYQVLIGTQMIAKGLDFEDVTLVGVINGDAGLNIPDFRSSERTFDLLSQVAGRAGRAKKEGRVYIQGFNLDHYSITCAKEHNYEKFYEEEMKIRKSLRYPPYENLGCLEIIGKKEAECLSECEKIATYLKRHLPSSVTILGPTASFLPKVQHAHSYQLLLKYKNSKEVRKEVTFLKKQYQKNTHVTLDIDLSL